MQNKIDRLILNANREFSDNRNVISALVDYSRSLDLFDFLEKKYQIQVHETIVRIAICYDILGNFNQTLDILSQAIKLIPNVASLILYKAVLLQTIGQHTEAQNCLLKYKQMKVKNELELFETFRIVFLYSMQLEKEVLLREIKEFFEKYKKNTVILYLRAMLNLDLSTKKNNSDKKNIFIQKYEDDIKEAMSIDKTDTDFLLKDRISNENLTKLFFMIVSEMDNYQPKALVNYSTFHNGFKLFYTIFKIIKLLKIKVAKKKLKAHYTLKLKSLRNKQINSLENSNSNSNPHLSNLSIGNDNTNCMKNNTNQVLTSIENHSNNFFNINKSSTNNTNDQIECTNGSNRFNSLSKKIKLKMKSTHFKSLNSDRKALRKIVSIKNNVEKANIDEYISEIKQEYEAKVTQLYNTVWINKKCDSRLNFDVDYDSNYFIQQNYYSPYNYKQNPFVTYEINSEERPSLKKNNKKNVNRNHNTIEDINISESIIKMENNDFNSSRAETLKLSFSLKEAKTSKNFKTNSDFKNNFVGTNKNSSNINTGTNNEYPANSRMKFINLNKNKDSLSKNFYISKNILYKPSPRMEVIKFNYNSKDFKKSAIDSNFNNNINENNPFTMKKYNSQKAKGTSLRKSLDIKNKIKPRLSEVNLRKNSNEPKNK